MLMMVTLIIIVWPAWGGGVVLSNERRFFDSLVCFVWCGGGSRVDSNWVFVRDEWRFHK